MFEVGVRSGTFGGHREDTPLWLTRLYYFPPIAFFPTSFIPDFPLFLFVPQFPFSLSLNSFRLNHCPYARQVLLTEAYVTLKRWLIPPELLREHRAGGVSAWEEGVVTGRRLSAHRPAVALKINQRPAEEIAKMSRMWP